MRAAPAIADQLDALRGQILEDWQARVDTDASLDGTTEWSRKQRNDHFPDVLEQFGRILRAGPEGAPTAEKDAIHHAHAHAKTRWLQGYSLRALIREWGHFNSAVVAVLGKIHGYDARAIHETAQSWSRMVNDQLTESAIEYHRLQQAEAQTRAAELARLLEDMRALVQQRGQLLGSVAASLRADLSVVITSSSLLGAEGTTPDQAELQAMSRSGVASLDRSLANMVMLARLEAGQEKREIQSFDASHGLSLLVSSLVHEAERAGSQLTWAGPETFPVEGDERNVRLIVRHLLLSGIQGDAPGPMDVEWGPDERAPERWRVLIRQHSLPGTGTSPPISREIARASDRAQQVQGIAPSGYELALQQGVLPVAPCDGVSLLIAKHLCELLDAGIELDATEGIVTYRVSLPRHYTPDETGADHASEAAA